MELDKLVCEIRNHIQAAEIASYMASLVADTNPQKAMELDVIHTNHINHAANMLFEYLTKEK